MPDPTTPEVKTVSRTVEVTPPVEMVPVYATNSLFQAIGGEHLISLFVAKPPYEPNRAPAEGDVVPSVCVAQILMSTERMREFFNVMALHLAKFPPVSS